MAANAETISAFIELDPREKTRAIQNDTTIMKALTADGGNPQAHT